jgi:mannose-1-phosphate guanylyltransferase
MDKDATIVVLPSDHYIEGDKLFIDTLSQAVEIAEHRRGLITIGVNPTRPETGYGYIEMGERINGDIATFKVERFTEKPNIEVAKDFILKGTYLWNSGMFVWRADVFLREMEKYLPKMYRNLMAIYQHIGEETEQEVIKEQYELIDGISVDFGIMQKTRKGYVIKCEFTWDDIGNFASLGRFLESYRGNNVSGIAFMEQSENCYVFGNKKLLIGFGVKDLIIVDAGDVILFMDKNKEQEVKHLVNEIKKIDGLDKYL